MSEKFILLVEDDPDDEALVLRSLSKVGIGNEIKIVRDGAEALDFLYCRKQFEDRAPSMPVVVMLDLNLPKLGGLEVLKILRENAATVRLPVVVLTSSDEESDLVAAYANGANSFVQKPVDFEEFGQAIQSVGLYWALLNKVP